MYENIDNSDINTPNQKKSYSKMVKYILLGLASLVIIFFLSLYFLKYIAEDDKNIVNEKESITKDVREDFPKEEAIDANLSLVHNKLFYSENNNLFSYDIDTQERLKWTNFEEKNNTQLLVTNVKDDNTVFFNFSDGEGMMNLYRLNLDTKEEKEIKNFGSNAPYSAIVLDVYSENKFVYQLSHHYEEGVTRDHNWSLILFENGNERTLSTGEEGGRHISFVDSNQAQFSADGRYLLYIGTMVHQRDKREYNAFEIYIYDLNNDTEKIITDATHPVWLDNENIVYVSLENPSFERPKTGAFYSYNVKTGASEKLIDLGDLAGKGIIYGEDLIYINQPKEIWRFNLQTKENTKIYTNLSESTKSIRDIYKIDEDKIIYITEETTGVPMPDYTINLLDLKTNETKGIDMPTYFMYLK